MSRLVLLVVCWLCLLAVVVMCCCYAVCRTLLVCVRGLVLGVGCCALLVDLVECCVMRAGSYLVFGVWCLVFDV